MKRILLLVMLLTMIMGSNVASQSRYTISLNGDEWKLWMDKKAMWRNDKLFLPTETKDLSNLPVNQPTGGWSVLCDTSTGVNVQVPGTVEEYLTKTKSPKPEDTEGVSWWWRKIKIPIDMKGRQIRLYFGSVRMRAEVYLDGRLVAYDIVGESPFDFDITNAVKFGTEQTLAVRVTNPGGNYDSQDFTRIKWGKYEVPTGRGFSGLIGDVHIECLNSVYISDVYMQNTPEVKKVNAIVTLSNTKEQNTKHDIDIVVTEKNSPMKEVFHTTMKNITITSDNQTVNIPIEIKDAKLWDVNMPNLYVCHVQLKNGKNVVDNNERTFGFRWFTAEGIGKDAILRLNGRRIVLRSAISWGYFPATGLYSTKEMANRQVNIAKEMGLNMLNFHRSIGMPVVFEAADSLGLLYYEEPGSFNAANNNTFIRTIANEKLHRMIKRDRSHPSLIIYNLINELRGSIADDKELTEKRMNDMKIAHALDPSRIMTFTSGWAKKENSEEDSKAHMRPFDDKLYRRGWFDAHRAGGPATWEQRSYKSPKENFMFSDNHTEIFMRGEEGAISTPPRIEKIYEEIVRTGKNGWDGLFWRDQYQKFSNYFNEKRLASSFGTIDNLTRAMGDISLYHQGRRIEGLRMQNIGDVYAINGWEAMPYDNHSGVVDIYRNPKGNIQTLAYYNQPLYVAVSTRSQIVRCPGTAIIDFYIVNEKNLNGNHTLCIKVLSPDGQEVFNKKEQINIVGGDTFGQLLVENVSVPIKKNGGMYRIEAEIISSDGKVCAIGRDEVLGVEWQAEDMAGTGAYYGIANDPMATFYKKNTGKELPPLSKKSGKLDWIVVNRTPFEEPVDIASKFFMDKDGKSTLQVTWFSDFNMRNKVVTNTVDNISHTFKNGEQPDKSLKANKPYSAVWEGKIMPQHTGEFQFFVETNRGVRLEVDGKTVLNFWDNKKEIEEYCTLNLKAGIPVKIKVEYRQNQQTGKMKLKWAQPNPDGISAQAIFDRAQNDGTTIILLNKSETWMKNVAEYTGIKYDGYFTIGRHWIGGVHFVKKHPLFEGLPVGDSMNWPYQAVVKDSDHRFGLCIHGEDLAAGAYRSWPFNLGTAVGVIPCGKGRIVFSTLNIVNELDNTDTASEVARKLFCNYIKYSIK